ncbi:hypothetical protein NHP21005_06620 [Helicobacter sp. NHP21005]|nr:hypothetical protein [Helicobacter sp. NHP21005]BEG56974.1 hypothetical protein NHP21005_06620 [Helicobacter sp. NHP21005]
MKTAIKAGFVDGYYLLGTKGIHGYDSFYWSLQMLREEEGDRE